VGLVGVANNLVPESEDDFDCPYGLFEMFKDVAGEDIADDGNECHAFQEN
jgi:hypothetical protein